LEQQLQPGSSPKRYGAVSAGGMVISLAGDFLPKDTQLLFSLAVLDLRGIYLCWQEAPWSQHRLALRAKDTLTEPDCVQEREGTSLKAVACGQP